MPVGQAVELRVVDQDRYGRTVAEVFKGGSSVNLQMVKDGGAAVYQRYLDGCAGSKEQYLQAEAQAKQQRLGMWAQDNMVLPWDFRRGQRGGSNPSPALPPSSPMPSSSSSKISPSKAQANPSSHNYNCSDFKTQVEVTFTRESGQVN